MNVALCLSADIVLFSKLEKLTLALGGPETSYEIVGMLETHMDALEQLSLALPNPDIPRFPKLHLLRLEGGTRLD